MEFLYDGKGPRVCCEGRARAPSLATAHQRCRGVREPSGPHVHASTFTSIVSASVTRKHNIELSLRRKGRTEKRISHSLTKEGGGLQVADAIEGAGVTGGEFTVFIVLLVQNDVYF